MPSYKFEANEESTPLLTNNSVDSGFRYPAKKRWSSGSDIDGDSSSNLKVPNSSSYNNALTSNDGNKNTNNVEEDNASTQDIKIYAKRWYILAVFSVLGILQVNKMLSLIILRREYFIYCHKSYYFT